MEFRCMYCNCPALFHLRNIIIQQDIRVIIYLYEIYICPGCQRNYTYFDIIHILNFPNNTSYTFIGSENEAEEQEIESMDVDDDNGVNC